MNDRLQKVIAWRACSISLTLLVTWLCTGDVKEASLFTFVLHLILMSAHYSFEILWDKNESR